MTPTSTHTLLATATATIVIPSPTFSTTFAPSPSVTTLVQARRTTIPATRALTRTATPKSLPIATTAPIVWDPRLDKLGIQLIPASVKPGELYWRIVKAEFWDEKERQGKHHIFVNVLDEREARLYGQSVIIEWPDERIVLVTENKPEPEYSANFPLDVNHYPPWGTLGAFTASVEGLPSDRVAGMGLPPKNIFVVYLLTFQRTRR